MNWIREHIKPVVFTIVIICLVAIILISSYNQGSVSAAGEAVQTAASVAEEPLTEASSGIKGFFTGIFGFRSIQRENYELRKEIQSLNEQLTEAQLDEQKLAQLRELDFSCGMAAYAGARIPTLREVYAAFAKSGMFFNVEIKCEQGDYRTLCEKALVLEKEAGMAGRVLYSSFNWDAMREVRALCPQAETALLYERALWSPQNYALQLGAGAVHPSGYTLLVPGVVRRCHKKGVRVHAWTIDSPFALRQIARMGVDAVITNRPAFAREILQK